MKNVVVCADLVEESLKSLKSLKEKIDLKDTTVHLVHAFEIQIGVMELSPIVYPTKEQYPEIEEGVLRILDTLGKDLGLKPEQIEKHCIFTHSKEQAISEFLKNKKSNMVVLSTRGKHGIEGFFASSLAEFLIKYSPCDVLVLRPVV